ncbi:MAG TPA: MFS transporter [Stellaceae bacterium]|nr:MFS transporter [Stellaceae bacterium]
MNQLETATYSASRDFFGWRVVWAAFTVAVFGWGFGFYGPSVFLHAIHEARGWSVPLVSAGLTAHYLWGAFIVANLPSLHRRFGVARVTQAGAAALALGIVGWAFAAEPWQLFAATPISGAGWALTGTAAINAMVSPWFVRRRPVALSIALNGSSLGGVGMTPIWVAAIAAFGFPRAALLTGAVSVALVGWFAIRYLAQTPAGMGQLPDGDGRGAPKPVAPAPAALALPGAQLWRSPQFLTIVGGLSIGLFAQIGLIAHLYSLLVPAFGAQGAAWGMGLATTCAVLGRSLLGWLMPPQANRRRIAALAYSVQIIGSIAFLAAAGDNILLLVLGILFFGIGIGIPVSLPPLIAQVEFAPSDVLRVVALTTAISQATYAFAPAAFGVLRGVAQTGGETGAAPWLFGAAAAAQFLGAMVYVCGKQRR